MLFFIVFFFLARLIGNPHSGQIPPCINAPHLGQFIIYSSCFNYDSLVSSAAEPILSYSFTGFKQNFRILIMIPFHNNHLPTWSVDDYFIVFLHSFAFSNPIMLMPK